MTEGVHKTAFFVENNHFVCKVEKRVVILYVDWFHTKHTNITTKRTKLFYFNKYFQIFNKYFQIFL